ncbi:MAG: serine/threonine-protein phosphatase [Acidobacteria bacterium]|nr:serine/threonine-protein phosphatase [Acidobacteriota bacterium]
MIPDIRTTNAQNIGGRPYQEDCFAILDVDTSEPAEQQCHVAVIADGMGGLAHGDAAARRAVQEFSRHFQARGPGGRLIDALRDALLSANAAVAQEAQARKVPGQMGTTMIAVAVCGGRMQWVSTGDSGLFLVRGGSVRRLNRAHTFGSFLDDQVKQGELPRELAAANPHREALTSYVGMSKMPEIDLPAEPLQMQEGDMVLLATDGLFKTLSLAEISEALSGPGDPAEGLVRRTLAIGLPQQDNVTVIAICCGEIRHIPITPEAEQEETAEMPKPELARDRPQPGTSHEAPPRAGRGPAVWLALALAAVALCWVAYVVLSR